MYSPPPGYLFSGPSLVSRTGSHDSNKASLWQRCHSRRLLALVTPFIGADCVGNGEAAVKGHLKQRGAFLREEGGIPGCLNKLLSTCGFLEEWKRMKRQTDEKFCCSDGQWSSLLRRRSLVSCHGPSRTKSLPIRVRDEFSSRSPMRFGVLRYRLHMTRREKILFCPHLRATSASQSRVAYWRNFA